MTWPRTLLLPLLTVAATWCIPTLVAAFAYSAQGGNQVLSPRTTGTPVVWEPPRVTMSLNLGSPNGALINGTTSWDTNAESALATWNTVLNNFFTFNAVLHDRCNGNDRFNTVAFDNTNCGDGFGDAIAITRTTFEQRSGGLFFRIDADVLFNTNVCFNAYNGPLQRCSDGTTLNDLQRVALHEFGHVLGLQHPDEVGQTVSAIMNSRISNLDALQADDRSGATFLYNQTLATPVALTVTKSGTGAGTVTSNPAGITCGTDCTENYDPGTVITFTPTPDATSTFTSWSANCPGGRITLNAATTCTATFTLTPGVIPTLLTVTKSGTGAGTVTSTPPGITCGADCTESYARNTVVTLTAAPDAASTFTSWSANCPGGVITLTAAATCTATFTAAPRVTLTVQKAGAGTGTVTSNPDGIVCGSDCTEDYVQGTVVTLTATPNADASFAATGWSANCPGGRVTLATATTCTATFTLKPRFTFTVTKNGTGTGTVTSNPAGIACGTDCTEEYPQDTSVTLTAAPDAGASFTAWSANCPNGIVTIITATTCTATFTSAATSGGSSGGGGGGCTLRPGAEGDVILAGLLGVLLACRVWSWRRGAYTAR